MLETDHHMPQIRNGAVPIGKVKLLPKLFRRMRMDPANAVFDRIGRAAIAGQRIRRLLRRHGRHGNHSTMRTILHYAIPSVFVSASLMFAEAHYTAASKCVQGRSLFLELRRPSSCCVDLPSHESYSGGLSR